MLVLAVTAAAALPASANTLRLLETYGAYCNDVYFGSDGGGIGGCIDVAALLSNDVYAALGAYQAGPESKSSAKFARDPLNDRGKLVARIGKLIELGVFEATATVRFGAHGGFVDDFTHDVRKALHDIFGSNTRAQRGNHGLKGIIGASGHIWDHLELRRVAGAKATLTPYMHGSLGTDNVEFGGGVMLGLQPTYANRTVALMEPQSGAYAPFFGDDGVGLFVAMRAVAHDSLYASRAKQVLGEAGFVAQFTVADVMRATVLASCTTKPYDGALDPDCKATVRVGILW